MNNRNNLNKAKYFRELAGKTQQQVAEHLGLTKSGYALKEQGKRTFTIYEGIQFADFIKQPVKKIFLS
jgi:DNA-binding XRE family transcriptional regulator